MISIIIIVKNDRGVRNTLSSLQKILKREKIEVIVIDASEGILDDIRNTFSNVKWITFSSKSKKKISIPEQRNIGVNAAKGDIIVFVDANCIPKKDWLINITKPILKEDEHLVCGRTISEGSKTIHDQSYDASQNKKYIDECATINLAIKKEVFKKVGKFDEGFEYGSDVDFTWRAIDAGYKIRYASNAVISHNWGDSKQEAKRSFRYGLARARLYKKHVDKLPRLFKKDYYILIYVLFLLLLPLAIIWPYYLLFIFIPFAKNYNKQPLQVLRDHFIYALGFIKGVVLK